nr:MAG TPA: hypothetical protein [Caudoviricetes sp.]
MSLFRFLNSFSGCELKQNCCHIRIKSNYYKRR